MQEKNTAEKCGSDTQKSDVDNLKQNFQNDFLITKKTPKVIDISFLLLIALLRAFSTQVFIVPNKFAPGGITGIASIIYNTVKIINPELSESVFFNPAFTMFVLHAPLAITAYFVFNKKFALRSGITLIGISAFLFVISYIKIPTFSTDSYDSSIKILAAVAGGAISGFCLGSLMKRNCSTGGTDLIGRMLQKKYPHHGVAKLILFCDMIVVMLSGLVGFLSVDYSDASLVLIAVLTPMLYSFITLVISSKVCDIIIKGYDSAVIFQIITNKAELIGEAIRQKLKKTATILPGKGVISNKNKDVVIFVVKKHSILDVKKILQSIDPYAFTYLTSANEVYGLGFKGF